jgi:membrane-bound serine protease (ClpP class)
MRYRWTNLWIVWLFCTPLAGAEPPSQPDRPVVVQVRLEDQTINPGSARLIHRALRQAEQEQAECVLLVLDTPGGLLATTRTVVKEILQSRVPVIVYVAPTGARAASAGMFITLAGHVAAMAPGTTIGAAHPVQAGGLPASGSTAADKVVNDTVAWARALARLRGRNADWTARAVRESVSATASEAVEAGVVDLDAEDVGTLLDDLDGREVTLARGKVRLRTAGCTVRVVEMGWGERVLSLLAHPTLAFLLLLFGFYGVLFELANPGWGVAGTLGVICLLLAFFGLAVLPVHYVGLALLVVALALFTAEVFITSYGVLATAGVVCLVLGGTMLIEAPAGFEGISLWVLTPAALATALITATLLSRVAKAHRGRVRTGEQALMGQKGVAREDFTSGFRRHVGMVGLRGELWTAISPAPITAGEEVEVYGREGLHLHVRPTKDRGEQSPP